MVQRPKRTLLRLIWLTCYTAFIYLVIKITGNPNTYEKLEEIIDVNAATITQGKQDINQVGEQIFQEVLAVASGKKTKAETFGFSDFSIATLAGAYAGI